MLLMVATSFAERRLGEAVPWFADRRPSWTLSAPRTVPHHMLLWTHVLTMVLMCATLWCLQNVMSYHMRTSPASRTSTSTSANLIASSPTVFTAQQSGTRKHACCHMLCQRTSYASLVVMCASMLLSCFSVQKWMLRGAAVRLAFGACHACATWTET